MPSDMPEMTARGVCASCGFEGDGQRQRSDGPFHCAACWGEASAGLVRDVYPSWWEADEAAAWTARALETLHPISFKLQFANGGEEMVEAITDKENVFFAGVGADKVWPATLRICRYLDNAHAVDGTPPGEAIEIGCGCGVPGVMLARRGWRVILTDLPWLLPLVDANVAANFRSDDPRRPAVTALRWGSELDAATAWRGAWRGGGWSFDARPALVYGADIAYFDEDYGVLLDTLQRLNGVVTVVAVHNRNECHVRFAAAARARDWDVEPAKVESSLHGYPVSTSYCCSRCSVFKLTRPIFAAAGLLRLTHGERKRTVWRFVIG